MANKPSFWENVLVGILVALLIVFAVAIMIVIGLVYWYGIPAA